MADLTIPCFVEDDAHRAFLSALLEHLATKEGWGPGQVHPDFRSSTGGSLVLKALQEYFAQARRGQVPARPILVIMLDGNCQGANQRKKDILEMAARYRLSPDQLVLGVPDPHIERWFLDQKALKTAVDESIVVTVPRYKCERGFYKRALRSAFRSADIHPLAGGIEYAADIVPHLALTPPSCGDEALKDFAHDLRLALRRLKGSG